MIKNNLKHINFINVNVWKYIGVFLFLLITCVHCYYTFHSGVKIINSDDSAELMLGRILENSNKILSSKWFYSTEIRVFNTNIIYSLVWKIFDSYVVVRTVSQAICLSLLYISQVYFYKVLNCKLYTVWPIILLLPISLQYYRIVLFGLYYIPYICISFLILALTISYVSKENNQKIKVILCIILSLLAGLGGMRQLIIYFIPAMLTSVFIILKNENSFNPFNWSKQSRRHFFCSFINLFASGLGYIINSKILSHYYHFTSWTSLNFMDFSFSKLESIINGYLHLVGFKSMEIMQVSGFRVLFSLIFILCLIIGTFVCYKRLEYKFTGIAIVIIYSIIANLLMILIYLFSDMAYADRYFIPTIVFLVPLFILGIENRGNNVKISILWEKLIFILLFVSIIVESYETTNTVRKQDLNAELRNAVSYLSENNYHYGYATYWCADVLTELSNGEIEMFPLLPQPAISADTYNKLLVYKWLVSEDTLKKEVDSKIFVLVPLVDLENYGKDISWISADKFLVYSNSEYYIYSFQDTKTLKSYLK